MSADFEIIPGILEKDWREIEQKIELVKHIAKTIHIDLIDGKFVSNKTYQDPTPFKKYTNDIFFELHLMVDNPIQYIDSFAKVGFKRFLGHIEQMPSQEEFVAKGQLYGEIGLALNGSTPIEKVTVSYEDLDALLIMTIEAGFSGQIFHPEDLQKVRNVKEKNHKLESDVSSFPIEVDGGINKTTILQAKDAGVTRFVSTSAIFTNGLPEDNLRLLENTVNAVKR